MAQITIPYGNFGRERRTYDVLAEYKGYSLCFIDGAHRAVSSKGLLIERNRLNAHLPELSAENWTEWVDWVWSLPGDTVNLLSGKPDFSGNAPFSLVSDCR